MKLFFIGCSHTFGDDLTTPQFDSWPALIAKHYNEEFTNAAISGGTNERSMYHVTKNLDNYDKFYIAWTHISRFTRYRFENNFEINFNDRLINQLYKNDRTFLEYGKLHYSYWYNPLYSFKQWLQQIILVQSLLEKFNKKYVMINTVHNNLSKWTTDWLYFNNSVKSMLCFDNMSDQQLFNEHIEIQELIKKINFDHFLGWGSWAIEDLTSQFPLGKTDHLLEQGHKEICNFILQNDIL